MLGDPVASTAARRPEMEPQLKAAVGRGHGGGDRAVSMMSRGHLPVAASGPFPGRGAPSAPGAGAPRGSVREASALGSGRDLRVLGSSPAPRAAEGLLLPLPSLPPAHAWSLPNKYIKS